MNQPLSSPDAQKFVIRCYHCRTAFDVFEAAWCDCLGREPSINCPACGKCFCKADKEYKASFWQMAPGSLLTRRLKELRQDSQLPRQKALPALHLAPAPSDAPLVLVVDDSRTVRMLAARAIAELGCQVMEAANAEEAFAVLESHHPVLVLTDALMPKLDGREMCRLIKTNPQTADIAVVLMSGLYTASVYKSEAMSRFRADGYLTKPVEVDQLRKVLDKFVFVAEKTRQCA
jgi:CheY-like chemotaxis protein